MRKAPSLRFLFSHPAHFIALGFGAGLSPIAPGTVGTLVALPLAALLRAFTDDLGFILIVAASFAIGVWAADRTGRDLGVADHSAIVWDEIAAFLLFRVFDVVKPPPARLIDREWHHGFGVMADDIVAGFYALLVFAFWQRVFA